MSERFVPVLQLGAVECEPSHWGPRFFLLTFLSTGAPQSTTEPIISDMGRLQVEASMGWDLPKTSPTNLVAVQQNAKPIRWWATLLSLESFSSDNEQEDQVLVARPVGLTLDVRKTKQLGNWLVKLNKINKIFFSK